MVLMENKKLYLEVLSIAQEIADNGPTLVNTLKVTEKKRLYSLIVEAFRSFSAFSRLVRMHFLVQSSAVLRLFVEEVSKITILSEHEELYGLFEKHCIAREEIIDMTQKERKLKVLEIFELNKNQYDNALAYLDYGWIKPISKEGKYGYHEMLKFACIEGSTILKWIDNLDQFIHQNVNSLSLSSEGFELFELDNIYLSCIFFEKLFVAFHNLTKKEFTFNGVKLFEDKFWPLYEKMLKPEDVIN